MTFEQALKLVLAHEGGYSNHPDDKGGETNYGITISTARANGYRGAMRDIPMHIVESIYRKLYWDKLKADSLPAVLRYPMFDAAINSGVSRSVMWLQEQMPALIKDGVLGEITLSEIKKYNPNILALRVSLARLRFLTDLENFSTFGKGWTRRILSILENTSHAMS